MNAINLRWPFFMFLILLWSSTFWAQKHYLLDNFTATTDRSRVILAWTMKPGASCYGIGILRSQDGKEFTTIGTIPGICGAENEPMSFTYIDENPIPNAFNRYVLEMGFSGRTEPPLMVKYIDLRESTSKVIPNPFTEYTHIYFENVNKTPHTINIYNSVGILVKSDIISNDVYYIYIEDHHLSLLTGIYYFQIADDTKDVVSNGSFFYINQNR